MNTSSFVYTQLHIDVVVDQELFIRGLYSQASVIPYKINKNFPLSHMVYIQMHGRSTQTTQHTKIHKFKLYLMNYFTASF